MYAKDHNLFLLSTYNGHGHLAYNIMKSFAKLTIKPYLIPRLRKVHMILEPYKPYHHVSKFGIIKNIVLCYCLNYKVFLIQILPSVIMMHYFHEWM